MNVNYRNNIQIEFIERKSLLIIFKIEILFSEFNVHFYIIVSTRVLIEPTVRLADTSNK